MAAPLLQNYGPGNVDEVLSTSLVNMIPGIRDNIFKSNPVFKWLYEGKGGGRMRRKGGAALSHAAMHQRNSTAMSYQRYDLLDVTPQDGLVRDQWPWAQYSVSVTIDGYSDRIANAGDSKLEDLLEAKKMQAEESLSLLLEQHLFAASPGAKDIQSLATVVATSGTVGGINGTTNSWWQACAGTASGSFAAQGRSDLTNAWNLVSIQNPTGGPEMLVSDQGTFQFYESSLVSLERFTDNKLADIGIENLKFKSTPWTWSAQATSGAIYLLHSKGLEFIVNSDTDFTTSPFVRPSNQDARTAQILLACALATGNRRKNAKLTGITA